MTFDPDQLAALAAVVDEGTFEGAARRLQVTPSAVSQRIRALEQSVGQVLVRRSRPVAVTPAGAEVVRLAAQVALLTADTWTALRSNAGREAPGRHRLPVAVNADSLATWFPGALHDLPAGVTVDIRRADQDATAAMLRDGTVLAAVTADRSPVQGCRVRPLGSMRYRAMAAPGFREAWFPGGPDAGAFAVAPVVVFGPDDALQHRFAGRAAGHDGGGVSVLAGAPVHHVPSTAGFVAVLAGGVGWGMVPEQEADAHAAAGTLVDVAPGVWLDVPLFWQRWSVRTPTLDDLTARVVRAAEVLRPVL